MLIPSVRLAARHHWTYRQLSTSVARRMKIVPVPVRSDNYAYLVVDEATKEAAAVDPYDMVKVNEAAETEGVHIVANLTTHHHYDHSGGNSVRFSLSENFAESTDPVHRPLYDSPNIMLPLPHQLICNIC